MKRHFPIIAVLSVFLLFFTGCSNPAQQTDAQAASSNAPQQQSTGGSTSETGTVENTGAANGDAAGAGAADSDAAVGTGYLYPAYIDNGDALKYGYVNKEGAFAIEPQFEYVYPFEDCGMAAVHANDREGVIDSSGRYILQPKYDYISGIYEDAIVAHGTEEGYILFNLKGDKLFVTNGSIGRFSGGLASYSRQQSDGSWAAGYIDKTGGIVIEPVFQESYGFNGEKAVVRLRDGKYALIDTKGKVLQQLDYNIIGSLAGEAFLYRTEDEKYGYLAEDGSKLTDAIYTSANSFEDGYAVVNTSEDYSNPRYGLIDRNGKYVLEPKYGGITPLGQGRFAVSASTDGNIWDTFSKKAIFTDKGEQITDMAYYNISRFKNGISSVSTDTQTFIIGLDGKPMEKFGVLDGVGTVECVGDLIEANIDGDRIYLTLDGKTVWKSERVFRLTNGALVKQNKYRPDRFLLVQYPVISNHPDPVVQDKLNSLLKAYFMGNNDFPPEEEDSYAADAGSNYGVSQVGDLLVIRQTSWYYPLGAAHGSSALSVYHMNAATGKEYTLKDLFKSGSDYGARLAELINRQIAQSLEGNDSMYLVDRVEPVKPDQGFILTGKGLQIFYQTYEIAAYAAGQPTFDIPYKDILDWIDTKGELWKLIENSVSVEQ
jgi:hypothetical protein